MRVVTGQTHAVGPEPVATLTKINTLVRRVVDTDEVLPVISPDKHMLGKINSSVVMHPMMFIR